MDASRTLKNRRGIAIVYIALGLIALVGFAALTIDVGYFYVVKSQLQNAADAAALAGAAKLNGRGPFDNYTARYYAQSFAATNTASNTPVSIDLNASNDINGDIVLGCWTGGENIDTTCAIPSAVKVVARRIQANNNATGTFFGKALGFDSVNITTKAIATSEPANILPITINEYWLQRSPAGQRPYGINHDYPNSFVRKINVDGSTSTVFGLTFAALGQDANDNVPSGGGPGSQNLNGFVNLNIRSSNHDGSGISWYSHDPTSVSPWVCGACSSGFTGPTDKTTSGAVAPSKFDEAITYLANGYPNNFIPPIPIRELARPTTGPLANQYPASNYPIPTSSCPYSTVAFFPSSGGQPLNIKLDGTNYMKDLYPAGKKFIAMIYDGTFVSDSAPNAAGATTTIGYSLVQVDGYRSGNPKSFLTSPGPTSPQAIGTSGNTLYVHSIEDILEPPIGGTTCNAFLDNLYALRLKAGTTKLVH